MQTAVDTNRRRAAHSQRVADRDHDLADSEVRRPGDLERRADRLRLDKREVKRGIACHDEALVGATSLGLHHETLVLGYVCVRDDLARRAPDDPGALASVTSPHQNDATAHALDNLSGISRHSRERSIS